MFTITDHLPQLLKLSAVLETFCQSFSTITTNLVHKKTACEQMYKEHSQVIRFCDVCASLLCILIISLEKGEPIFNTTDTVSSKWLSVSYSKEKLYHSVVWHFLQHSIDIAQAQCVPVLSPLHIGQGYLEIIEQ